ncbi:MAG: efflux RND transporter periplasmic adaptor subunit [Verrucomicrobiota bacterium]
MFLHSVQIFQRGFLTACAPALLAGFLAGGCKPSTGSPHAKPSADAQPRAVSAICAASQAWPRTIRATGSLAAFDQATLSTKVSGYLQELPVDLGTVVSEQQVVAKLDSREYALKVQQSEALLAQARARLGLDLSGTEDSIDTEQTSTVRQARAVLDEAKANRDRIMQLSVTGVISRSELDTAQAAFEVASSKYQDALIEVRNRQALVAQRRAELEIARQEHENTSIRAPFAGAIQERRASLGEYLPVGSPVVTIVRMNPLRLRLEVSERDAAKVQLNQKVVLRLEGSTNVYSGQVTRLSPALDAITRMLWVEADVPNPGTLRPGSFARAEIVVQENSPALAVPTNAVVTFAGLEKVFVVRQGKADEVAIATGRRSGDLVEVVQGLQEGDFVVLNPGNLQPGQPVQIRK